MYVYRTRSAESNVLKQCALPDPEFRDQNERSDKVMCNYPGSQVGHRSSILTLLAAKHMRTVSAGIKLQNSR